MVDVVDARTRSRMMGAIRGRNTKPELLVRRGLHKAGYRFRLHSRDLPGRPDIVLPKWNAVVLIHGCFWHRHEGCRFTTTPTSRAEFWSEKFAANTRRDRDAKAKLLDGGWRVATVWECSLRRDPERAISAVVGWLRSAEPTLVCE